jgi:hypothetical protein
MMKILEDVISSFGRMPIFIRGLCIAFIVFVIGMFIKSFRTPDTKRMADI